MKCLNLLTTFRYFDINGDKKVDLNEFRRVIERDEAVMAAAKAVDDTALLKTNEKATKRDGLKREPGIEWILDFNNDGYVSVQEMDAADQVLQGEPAILPHELMMAAVNKQEL